jgi:hypothetical protein
MAKGAPQGNQNARKEETGCKLTIYLTIEDLRQLRYILQKYGHEDVSIEACKTLARSGAKMGINLLLQPDKYELATKRVIAPKKEKTMIELTYNSQFGLYEAEIDGKELTVDPDVFAECEQERRKTYIESGMPEDEAEQKAWDETREATQWLGCHGATFDGVAQG